MAFLARGSGFQLFITPDAAVLRFPDQVVRMELAGANRDPQLSGADRLPGQSHYLTGETWIRHVPHFGRVNLRGVYRGIDLSYYGNGSQLEYDFVIHPDADPRLIAIDIHGAGKLMVGNQGELRIATEAGEIVWNAPVAYQEDRNIKAEYVLRGKRRVGFRLGAYDRSKPVVIDPMLAWSTLLGGTGFDHAYAVAVDATENAVVTGDAGTSDFPTTAGAYKRTVGGVFVSKLNAAGTALIYSTFLGPGRGNSIALHGGNAYVAGTGTNMFPVTAGAYNNSALGNNVFITKLTSDGSDLVYSALLGQGLSEGWGIAVDSSGNAYVTGRTTAPNFPTTASAFQPIRATQGQLYLGDLDAFFVKLNATGTALLYSTYLGSTDTDLGQSVAVDSSGHAYVTGSTTGRSVMFEDLPAATLPFPTTAGAYKTVFTAGAAPFVTKFDPTASGAASVVYSTLLGANLETSTANGIAVDSSGHAYVTGGGGANYPLTGSTSLTTSTSGPAPPSGFQLSTLSGYFELTTTATYVPPVTVCVSYAGSISSDPPQLFHYEGGVWKDITKLPIDTVNQIVCGEVSSLSPFALFEPVNHPPVADAGADRVVECPTLVTLDGSQSSDPDHDSLTYLWTGPFGEAHGVTTTVNLPLGVTTATLTVSDGQFTSTDTVQITVQDTVAPVISSATASPHVLWPPEHKMEPVTVTLAVSDLCDPAARCRIEDVTSNEPADGLGDGDTSPDWKITGELTLELRAERSAKGSGRIYTITVRCTDASNNSSVKTVAVTVPRHR